MPQPKKAAGSAEPAPPAKDEPSNLEALRELLGKGVLLSGDGLKEAVDEAVRRGRMTRRDAEDLVASLVAIGRRQTQDAINELETLVGKGTSAARKAVVPFPISDYDDLTAAQITEKLAGLSNAELGKVRDHERRNANRKSVLGAVDRALG